MKNLKTVIPATSLCLRLGQDYGFTNGGGNMPAVCMNFPPLWAEVVASGLLRPYAKPEDCFVGMRQNGECFEINAFCIVEVPVPTELRLVGLDIPDHGTFVIDNDADIPIDGVIAFMERRQQMPHHEFFLTVGIEYPDPRRTPILSDRWKVTLRTMLGDDIRERMSQRLGLLPSMLLSRL
ncbi:MAG: hypothetical protein HY567_03145 [Candidatus Kerfeldbacteria bacterium]|nr:hypothetical protein [Candidatus Kerfeldbacteria bacterium]